MKLRPDTRPAPPQVVARPTSRRRRGVAALLVVSVVLLFGYKTLNYASPHTVRFTSLRSAAVQAVEGVQSWIRNAAIFHTCEEGVKREVLGGYLCSAGRDTSRLGRIYNSYPLQGGAMAAIYPGITAPAPATADALVDGKITIPRYPVYTPARGADWWSLDPHKARYWRFYYYSLRPTVSLVNAYIETGQAKYLTTLRKINSSFLRASATSPLAWSDEHSVAFRGMVLTYQWWTLREHHALTEEESAALLTEISRTAEYLADPNHYQPHMNHGTNQIAALLLIAQSFPDLPGSRGWQDLAKERLDVQLQQIIDADGVLIENSPYYDFYELDKFWQIHRYGQELGLDLSPRLEPILKRMIRYATYILQPDGSVPLLGASLAKTINHSGSFRQMAETDPQFRYVLTRGEDGDEPSRTSIHFPTAGHTILRSGWEPGEEFTQASQMTFNVGDYRTTHSQLDSLGITLYGNGETLLPPGGLYTYEPGPMHEYFQGTSSHNAVVVDGQSQARAAARAGPLTTTGGVTYQSAESPVYDDVTNRRTVVMVDKDHYLVLDRLDSEKEHLYEQMWHLFPGAKVTRDGLTVSGVGRSRRTSVTIQQLQPEGVALTSVIGQKSPPAGLCSEEYEVAIPCQQLAYSVRGRSAAFATLLTIGPRSGDVTATYDRDRDAVTIRNGGRTTRLELGVTEGKSVQIKTQKAKVPAVTPRVIAGMERPQNWVGLPAARLGRAVAPDNGGRSVLRLAAPGGPASATNDAVTADLAHSNLHVRLKVTGVQALTSINLDLTSDGWTSYSRLSLRGLYPPRFEGEWITLSISRDTGLSTKSGYWRRSGAALDWSRVNGIRFTLDRAAAARTVPPSALELDWVRSAPEQAEGAVVIVFDDGYESILPAAEYMHSKGIPGNVGVIGRNVKVPTRGNLNVFQLRRLQDEYGWNMVNHSQRHVDAVENYHPRRAYGAYERDVLDGAQTLERLGLNSAPNWYVYPHGTTNSRLEAVVGRFYSFARVTDPGTDAFPFGSPHRVRAFGLSSPGDLKDGSHDHIKATPVSQVVAAIRDAKRYRSTLFLTAHRIKSTPSDRPGYPLAMFKQVVDAIVAEGLQVKTLSELDAMNGVIGTDTTTVTPAVPSLITVRVSTTGSPQDDTGLLGWIRSLF
jgi:peptidoglycan/xylan/chitin deacetylase (PgdA/CDA1 family)